MNASKLFELCSTLVMPAWLLLIVLPRAKWTRIIAAYAVPSALALVYLTLLATNRFPEGGGFSSLAQVERLFSSEWLLLAGWIHYLAFDLFVGAWEVRDAARLGIPHGYVIPCLILTFLLGPIGLLLYFFIRAAVVRRAPARA
jgi:hypothetical protein